MASRKQFTPECKREAVQLLESGSRSRQTLPASLELPVEFGHHNDSPSRRWCKLLL
jgi:hypothetical protein